MYHPTSLGNAFLEACAILFFLCLLLLALLSLFKVPDVQGEQPQAVKERVRQATDGISRAAAGNSDARTTRGIRNEAPTPIYVPDRVSADSINQDLLLSAAPAELRGSQRGEVLDSPRPTSAGLIMADRPSGSPVEKVNESKERLKKKVKIQEPSRGEKVDPTVAGAREKKESKAPDKAASEEEIEKKEAAKTEEVKENKQEKEQQEKQKGEKEKTSKQGAKEAVKEKEKKPEVGAAELAVPEEKPGEAVSSKTNTGEKQKKKKDKAGEAVASTAVEESTTQDPESPAKSAKGKVKETESGDAVVTADKTRSKNKSKAEEPGSSSKSGEQKKQGAASGDAKETSGEDNAKKDEAENETAAKSSKTKGKEEEAEVVGHREKSAKDKNKAKGKGKNEIGPAAKEEADADAEEMDEDKVDDSRKAQSKPTPKEAARKAALKRQRDDIEALRNERELGSLSSRGRKEEQRPESVIAAGDVRSEAMSGDAATRFNAREKPSNTTPTTGNDANPEREERIGLNPGTRADAAERRKAAKKAGSSNTGGSIDERMQPEKSSDLVTPEASAPPQEAPPGASLVPEGQTDRAAESPIAVDERSTMNDRALEAPADRGVAFASRHKDERSTEDVDMPPPSPDTIQKVEERWAEEASGRTSQTVQLSNSSPDGSVPEVPKQSTRDQRQQKRKEEKHLKEQKAKEAKEAVEKAEEMRSLELAISHSKLAGETASASKGASLVVEGSVVQPISPATDTKVPTQGASVSPPPWEPMEGRLGQADIRGITGQDRPEPEAAETVPITFRDQVEREAVRPQRVAQALDAKYSLNNLTPDNGSLPPPTYADSREQDVADIHAVVRDVTGADVAAEDESVPLRSRPAELPRIAQGRRTEQLVPDKNDDMPDSPAGEPLYASVPDEKQRHRMLDQIAEAREAASRRQRDLAGSDRQSLSRTSQGRDDSSGSVLRESPEPGINTSNGEFAVKPLRTARVDTRPIASPKLDEPVPTRAAMREAAERREAAMRRKTNASLEQSQDASEDLGSISVMKEAAARRNEGKRTGPVPQPRKSAGEESTPRSHNAATPNAEDSEALNPVNGSGGPSKPDATNAVPTGQEPSWSFDNLKEPQEPPVTVNIVRVPEPSAAVQEEALAQAQGQKVQGRSFGHRAPKNVRKAKGPPTPITVAPNANGPNGVSPILETDRRAYEARQEARAAGKRVPPSPAISDDLPSPVIPTVPAVPPRSVRGPTKKQDNNSRGRGTGQGPASPQQIQSNATQREHRAQPKRQTQSSDASQSSASGNQSHPTQGRISRHHDQSRKEQPGVSRGSRDPQPYIDQIDRPTYPPSSKPTIDQDVLSSQADNHMPELGIWAMIKTSPFWTLCALSFATIYVLGARQLFALAQVLNPSSSDVARKRQDPADSGESSGATTWKSNHAPWLDGTGLFALINVWHVVFLTALIIVAMVIQDNATEESEKTEATQTFWQRITTAPKFIWGFLREGGSKLQLKSFGVIIKVIAILLTIGAFAACLLYLDFLVSKLASVSSTVAESEQTGVAALVLLNIVFFVFVPILTFEFVLCLQAYLTWYRSKARSGCGGNSGSDAWACAFIACPC